MFALRDARVDATLCSDCRDKVPSRYVQTELYGMGRHTTAHLYAVPVLVAFDAVRNCSHCRSETDDDCAAWRKLRKAVAVLRQESRRIVKGVDELLEATGGRTANIYEFACGSVAYFAPDAPDFREAVVALVPNRVVVISFVHNPTLSWCDAQLFCTPGGNHLV